MVTVEDVDGDGWRRLICVNDWGTNGYFWSAVESDSGQWSIAGQDRSKQVFPGTHVRVRWPDGSESTEELRGRTKRHSVPDMGHSYDVETYVLVIERTINGQATDVAIDRLRFKPADE